jgi:hypothetical protein
MREVLRPTQVVRKRIDVVVHQRNASDLSPFARQVEQAYAGKDSAPPALARRPSSR